jgi:hypothetical protein
VDKLSLVLLVSSLLLVLLVSLKLWWLPLLHLLYPS